MQPPLQHASARRLCLRLHRSALDLSIEPCAAGAAHDRHRRRVSSDRAWTGREPRARERRIGSRRRSVDRCSDRADRRPNHRLQDRPDGFGQTQQADPADSHRRADRDAPDDGRSAVDQSVNQAIIGNVSSAAPLPHGLHALPKSDDPRFLDRHADRCRISIATVVLLPNERLSEHRQSPDRSKSSKGPSAMLYGRIEPGGLVDMIVKRPLENPYYSVQQQGGSFGVARTTLDATGPLTAGQDAGSIG